MSNQEWADFEAKKEEYMTLDEFREQLRIRENKWWYPLSCIWYRTIGFLKDIPYRVRSSYQIMTRGYADYDVWGLNTALVRFTYPRLKMFVQWQSEHGHGTPEDFEQNPAEWLNVLNKMLRSFTIMAEDDYLFDMEPPEPNYPKKKEEYPDEAAYKTAQDAWIAEYTARDKECQDGLELFAKYFRNLWD